MGILHDEMLENEGLRSLLKQRNKKIAEQKKLIVELSKGIVEWWDACSASPKDDGLIIKAKAIINNSKPKNKNKNKDGK